MATVEQTICPKHGIERVERKNDPRVKAHEDGGIDNGIPTAEWGTIQRKLGPLKELKWKLPSMNKPTVSKRPRGSQLTRKRSKKQQDTNLQPTTQSVERSAPNQRSIPVDVPQNVLERLRHLRFTSELCLEADDEAKFESEDYKKDCDMKLQKLVQYLDQNRLEWFRGWAQDSPIWLNLVSITGSSNEGKAPYICIQGLKTSEQIAYIHSRLSTKSARKIYYPLKLCYDRRIVSRAAAEKVHLTQKTNLDYTLCGKLLRTQTLARTFTRTIGGLVHLDDQIYALTTAHQNEESQILEQVPSPSMDALSVDDFDEDVEQALVVDVTSWKRRKPTRTQEEAGLPESQERAGTPSSNSWTQLGEVIEQGSDWQLHSVDASLQRPNCFEDGGDRKYISSFEETPLGRDVILITGRSGICSGVLSQNISYLKLSPMQSSFVCWTVRLMPGNALHHGDSGSWAIDAGTNSALGHVVAFSEGFAFLLPFGCIFREIEQKFKNGSHVRLPSPFDLLANLARNSYSSTEDKARLARGFASEALTPGVLHADPLNATVGMIQNAHLTQTDYNVLAHLLCVTGANIAVALSSPGQWIRDHIHGTPWADDELKSGTSNAQILQLLYTLKAVDTTSTAPQVEVNDPRIAHVQRSENIHPEIGRTDHGTLDQRKWRLNRLKSISTEEPTNRRPMIRDCGMASTSNQTTTELQTETLFQDDASSINSALAELFPENVENTFITKSPEERFRLGYWSVIGLIINCVIGTGIFNSPSIIMLGTRSVGITLLFWLAGALYTITGTYLSIEFGLNTPRYNFEGVKQGIPRSGGTLNYLQYIYIWPAYRPRSRIVLLITCVFAMAYIILGNMAGNCLIFGIYILEAANVPGTNSAVRGIAVGAATFACGIHAFSRRGGIYLGNVFAVIKVLMLLMVITTGICAWTGVFHTKTYAIENMTASYAFSSPSTDSYGYVKAFLAVIFAWSGFDQPNYVLGEIKQPRKKFPISTAIGVAVICFLYLLVNIAYMIVVPKEAQLNPDNNVALLFFQLTFGTLSNNPILPKRILTAFLAISSFGNVIVMTFTATRVKQEIAKEGILPFAKFFGQTRNYSLGRILLWLQKPTHTSLNRMFYRLWAQSWLDTKHHSQETPFGALFLHWVFTVIVILATIRLRPFDAYRVLVDLYSYTIVAIFGFLIGFGMLKLRFSSRQRWRTKSSFMPFFSIISATIFTIGSAYPIIASWVPPHGAFSQQSTFVVAWFTTPAIAWGILGFGGIWYLGFCLYAAIRARKDGVEFQVKKVPEFKRDPQPNGPLVQVHETVFLTWVAKEHAARGYGAASISSRESF